MSKSIDEVIEYAREVAERERKLHKENPDLLGIREEFSYCRDDYAEEHEQLVSWLEELKKLREHLALCNARQDCVFANKLKSSIIDEFEEALCRKAVEDRTPNDDDYGYVDIDEIGRVAREIKNKECEG